ncbi:hypothetical protein [Ruminococcus bicirculans (ex Wegman et al. 2014)]
MSEIMTEGKKAKLIDETVYNDPYVVKSNCLYEMVLKPLGCIGCCTA